MTTQMHRYRTTLSHVLHPINIKVKQGFPTVYQQADELGGTFTRITAGLPKNAVANFSPSILKHKGATIIAWRCQPEPFCFRADMKYLYYNSTPTDIYVGQLVSDTTVVAAKKIRNKPHRLSLEDPRLFLTPDDELYCQAVTSSYASRWDNSKHKMVKNPKVCAGALNEFGELVDCIYPPIGGNLLEDKAEKNWCFFSDKEHLRLLYSTIPLVIKTPGQPDKIIDSECLKQVTGPHATFNSTAPIPIDDDGWLVFFHWKHMAVESLDARPHLVYHLGAYMLDKKFTKITHMLKEPVFSGSTNDELITWTDCLGNPISNQPACILPFGCFEEDGELVLSLGVNDSFMGIFRTDLANLLALMDCV
jgi:hypothetical protein